MARKKRPKRGRPKKGRTKVIPASKRKEWKTDGLDIVLDALEWSLAVVDGVEGAPKEGIIPIHNKAIEQGVRADNGQPQPPMTSGSVKWQVERGIRPNLRGVTHKAKGFAKGGLSVVSFFPRSKKGVPKRSKIVLGPPRGRPGVNRFLYDEMEERGIEYLFTNGEVDVAIDANLKAWIDSFVF